MTNENWEEKFPSEAYLELFRFRKGDMNLLATALEVFPEALKIYIFIRSITRIR